MALTIFFPVFCKAEPGAWSREAQGNPNLKWLFDMKEDKSGIPRGKVYLLVGERKVLIRSNTAGQYNVLERADYKSKNVPASAMTACSGWWAGQGEDLYVIRRNKQLIVFIRYLDEGAPIPGYRRLKVIPLPGR